jgi:hypothetical protein
MDNVVHILVRSEMLSIIRTGSDESRVISGSSSVRHAGIGIRRIERAKHHLSRVRLRTSCPTSVVHVVRKPVESSSPTSGVTVRSVARLCLGWLTVGEFKG